MFSLNQAGSDRQLQIHPAFSPPLTSDAADLRWDLSRYPDFDVLASTARVRLQPEEHHTFLTHPPVTRMRIRLARMPTLSFDVRATPPTGVTLADFLIAAFEFATRRLSTDEYASLGKEGQEKVRTAASRRTGGSYAPLGETPYTVLDALGSRRMFLALVASGEPGMWFMATTRKSRRPRASTDA